MKKTTITSKIYTILALSIYLLIPYNLSADAQSDGSYSHSIAIKIPPSIGGLAPNLSINYNSNGGDGPLGIGWQLNGLSYISRDIIEGIYYKSTDKFIHSELGKLVIISPNNLKSKKESFSEIESFGDCLNEDGQNGGPCRFKITDKTGMKFYYGGYEGSEEGRIEAVGKNKAVRIWALSKVEDLYGNYYLIEYYEDTANGDYYPKKITYTYGPGISKYRTIDFEYSVKTDHFIHYSQSSKIDEDQRLDKIVIRDNAQLVRAYELIYSTKTSTSQTYLTSVKETGSEGVDFVTQTFSWNWRDPAFDSAQTSETGYCFKKIQMNMLPHGEASNIPGLPILTETAGTTLLPAMEIGFI